jgi:hypothetical protein
MQNPLNYLLDRLYYTSHIRLLIEGVLLASLFPTLRFLTWWAAGSTFAPTPTDHAFFALFVAPWFETLIIFVPIVEALRGFKVKSWVNVLVTSVAFGLIHPSFILGFYLGIAFSLIYVLARRFSFLHAVMYSTIVHFVYNLFIFGLQTLVS